MFRIVFAIAKKYSASDSAATVRNHMAKLNFLGHKKGAKDVAARREKSLKVTLDKKLRQDEQLQGYDKLVAQARRELAAEAALAPKL